MATYRKKARPGHAKAFSIPDLIGLDETLVLPPPP